MPSPTGRAVVLCPLAIERAAVQRVLVSMDPSVRPVVIQTGVGKDAIVRAVQRLGAFAPPGRPSIVVLAGCCGALAQVDDVPAIVGVVDEHRHSWGSGGPLCAPLAVGFDARGVTLIAVDRIVSTPADKHALHNATGAAIVDMESHAFAAACERHGLRYAIVRGVSDTPDETLPHETLRWIRPDGSTRTARAVVDLLKRPRLIPHMVSFMRRCARVLPKVGERVRELLAADVAIPVAPVPPPPVPIREPPLGDEPVDTLVLFGGSFDPPTLAHFAVARDVEAHLERTTGGRVKLLFVPAARSPHKHESPHATDAQRTAMLRAMPGAATVWLDELDRAHAPGAEALPSYSIDTARRARRWLDEHGRAATKLRLLIGADQAAAFHRWREPRELIALAEPLVMLRGAEAGGIDNPASLLAALRAAHFWSDPELEAWDSRVLPIELHPGSATEVRDLIAARGVDAPELERLLAPGVLLFIKSERLYTPLPHR
jgi:nicotinate (nicotinamide) nucleotide adenylyltransferase